MPSFRPSSFAPRPGRSVLAPALLLALGGCAEAGPWSLELSPIEPPSGWDSSVGPKDGGNADAAFGDDGSADGGTAIDAGPSCVPTGAVDEPDDAFLDADCDGVDGVAAKLVFVATTGSDSAGSGTPESPYRTIGRGIVAAAARMDGSGVAVSKGTYAEHVALVDGVSVYGGYDASMGWVRSAANTTTIQQPSTSVLTGPNGFQYVEAVLASGITLPTTLDRFTIVAGEAGASPTTTGLTIYGVRVAGSVAPMGGTGLRLRNLSVTAGRGSNGANGATGATGEDGVVGGDGKYPGDSASTIGLGGVATCGTGGPVNVTRGGNGGRGGGDSLAGCGGAGDGVPGAAPFGDASCGGGAGGSGAACFSGRGGDGTGGSSSCGAPTEFLSADPPAAPTKAATVTAGLLVPTPGGTGARGPHGAGGSGGGGSGADASLSGFSVGASGGGGGSGGCGGYPGNGGQAGGASVALLVVDSSGIVVEASHFTSSNAGNGGRGGEGGAGGRGRGGGNPATSREGAKSGVGGAGRAGGYGAPGGGGSGGSSLAQVICNSSNVTGVDASTGTAGSAGTRGAGASNGAGGPLGLNGVASVLLESCTAP